MRVSTAIFCTLATLAAKDANQLAIANPLPPDSAVKGINTPKSMQDKSVLRLVTVAVSPELPSIELTAPIQPDESRTEMLEEAAQPTFNAADLRSLALEPDLPAIAPEPVLLIETNAAVPRPAVESLAAEVSVVETPVVEPIAVEPFVELSNQAGEPATIPTLLPLAIDASQIPGSVFARFWRSPVPVVVLPRRSPMIVTIPQRATSQGVTPQGVTPQGSLDQNPPAAPEFFSQVQEATPIPVQLEAEPAAPPEADVQDLQEQLRAIEETETFGNESEGSPAITLSNPSGYGADNFEGFANFSYQSRTRFSDVDDATMGIGIGFGDARDAVGLQLSYTLASFGSNRDFGTGGFNAKLHRQLSEAWSVALGWEGFATTGEVDFDDSIYGTVTHVARLRPDLGDLLSRVALTAGVGNGRFRSEADVFDDDEAVNLFGSVAVRVARPLSAIVEWTGQDLAAGLSIAPIREFPLVVTPAVRDITGAGDGARFVLGVGVSWQF